MGEDKSSVGFAAKDVKMVHHMLAKHVVAMTYDDAVRRGIVSKHTASEELRAISRSYDEAIVACLQGRNGNGERK